MMNERAASPQRDEAKRRDLRDSFEPPGFFHGTSSPRPMSLEMLIQHNPELRTSSLATGFRASGLGSGFHWV